MIDFKQLTKYANDDAALSRYVSELAAAGEDLEQRDLEGSTLLLYMTELFHAKGTVGLLISLGANVNAVDDDGKTPLHMAAQNQPEAIPALLAAGANVNAKDISGDTPLSLAASFQPEAVQYLIGAGADVNSRNNENASPLHYAAADIIPILVKAGADINAKSSNGNTPLHNAAQYEPDSIPALIDAGADVNAQNNMGLCPLFLAAKFQPCAVQTLIDAGANIFAEDRAGQTVFDFCRASSEYSDEERADMLQKLTEAGRNQITRSKAEREKQFIHDADFEL